MKGNDLKDVRPLVDERNKETQNAAQLEILCTRMAERRKDLKLTQQEVADCCGVSKSSIWNYENKRQWPTVDTLYSLAKKLDCSVSYLLGLSDTLQAEDCARIKPNSLGDIAYFLLLLSQSTLVDNPFNDDFSKKGKLCFTVSQGELKDFFLNMQNFGKDGFNDSETFVRQWLYGALYELDGKPMSNYYDGDRRYDNRLNWCNAIASVTTFKK